MFSLEEFDRERPVLIAGPTASGKSALALQIADRLGGVIVNADALQVFENWRVLTARPSAAEEDATPHRLYGYVGRREDYSVGHWLRDIIPLLDGPERPIIVGGTGLNFSALTSGLVEIPPVPATVRTQANDMTREQMLVELDDATREKIDINNPARVQRAWEVLRATGRGLAIWQSETPPPMLPIDHCRPVVIDAPKIWLDPRIDNRFDWMLENGALDEAQANLDEWSPHLPSSKAIGAPELIAHLQGKSCLETAKESAKLATRQYAKRQRTWFRARMNGWRHFPMTD